MAEDETQSASPSRSEIDSLTAQEFAVEMDGERMNGLFRVSGLIPFKLDTRTSMNKPAREPFRIAKMVQRDPANAFNRWLRETYAAREDILRPRRELAVVALDEGRETRRWQVRGAYLIEIAYSDFNTASNELLEEVLTIAYDSIDELWPE